MDQTNLYKYIDGKKVDLYWGSINKLTNPDGFWFTTGVDLFVDFDGYPEISDSLYEIARRYLPDDELDDIEEEWVDDLSHLVPTVQLITDMNLVQKFVNEINATIAPIKDECYCEAYGEWTCLSYPYGKASWEWIGDGFRLSAVAL